MKERLSDWLDDWLERHPAPPLWVSVVFSIGALVVSIVSIVIHSAGQG